MEVVKDPARRGVKPDTWSIRVDAGLVGPFLSEVEAGYVLRRLEALSMDLL